MMILGIRLRELARRRVGVALSFALACIAALATVYQVGLIPPKLTARSAQPAGAHTQLLVDDKKVSVLTAGFDTNSFGYLHQGAVLAGTLMVSAPTRSYIAERAQIPDVQITFSDPQVPEDQPPAQGPPPKYSVTVAARPTVPVLDVYASAPTTEAARRLVNASVAGLSEHLAGRGDYGLRVTQVGQGADVTAPGSGILRRAVEAFLAVLALGCTATLTLSEPRHVRRVAT